MLNETQQKIFDFIYNQKQQNLTLEYKQDYKTIFFKTKIDVFDFVYCYDYVKTWPSTEKTPYTLGIIDTRTNKLYLAKYNLTRYFEQWNPETKETTRQDIGNTTQSELEKKFEELKQQEIDKLAQTIPDDSEPDENNEYVAREEAENLFYYGERITKQNPPPHETSELIQFIKDPNKTIQNTINNKIEDITNNIKYKKLINRLKQQYLKEIETDEQYKQFRQAKEIKNSIPETTKQVTIKYLLEDGETIIGKYDAHEIQRLPYWRKGDQVNFIAYGWDSKTREIIRRKQSKDDLFIENIQQITYNGKTIYTNPDHTGKEGA